jgi:hypothetical protein
MKTPAGKECKYFFGDYFRGRNHEECNLVGTAWTKELCAECPVPVIIRANECETMRLHAEVIRPLGALFKKRVKVTAFCEKTGRSGFDPHIGCGDCHPVPPVFQVKK